MELASSRTLPGHDASVSARSESTPIERTGDNGARRQASARKTYRAARTHLQIRDGEKGPVAELFAWDRDPGPQPFLARSAQ
jgi:hypothetical protein